MNTQAPTKAATGVMLASRSVLSDMAERFGMEREAFHTTLMKTVMPAAGATNEQVAAFLVVAKHYDLNPFTKEIYAFPAKGGGVQPVVSIDGWLKIINSNPYYDGMEFDDNVNDDGILVSITCRIFRKDRTRPTVVTEYMAECKRPTDPWRQWPIRMLRHKATIQCARYAFGYSDVLEIDEYERIMAAVVPVNTDVGPRKGSAALRHAIVHSPAGNVIEGAAETAREPEPEPTPAATDGQQQSQEAPADEPAATSPPPPPTAAHQTQQGPAPTRRRAPPAGNGGGFGAAN